MDRRLKTPAGHTRDEFYSRLEFEVPKAMKQEIMSAAKAENTYMSVIVREAIAHYLNARRYKKVL